MAPFIFEIFGFQVYSYGMAMVFAFAVCIIITRKYVPRDLLSNQDLYNFCLFIMASLLFGTKLVNLFIRGDFRPVTLLTALKFWERGNFSFYPAFLFAVTLIFLYCRAKRIPLLKAMDYLLPIAILGIAIQRTFGCFLAGCCYGRPTDLPWGITFPELSRAGAHFPGVHLHPTQLYYGVTAFAVFIFLMVYRKHARRAGETTALGFMMLSVTYFFITFLRGDIAENILYHYLSRSQYLALGLFITGFLIHSRARFQRKKCEKILPSKEVTQ